MIINIQDDILKLHSMGLLAKLLGDRTTKRNIMWATNAYHTLGVQYGCNEEITPDLITGTNASTIKTRARKAMEQQSERTRQRAEVFTPVWVCKKMNDHVDEMWFGAQNVFFEGDRPTQKVVFPAKKSWKKYVDSRRLEITCGEAPYLVSRYDVETGEAIPVHDRIGVLDRKLRVVSENAQTEAEWLEWAARAFWAAYGYEFQGDNVLIARVNLLMTFEEYMGECWQRKPTRKEYEKIADIIAWNLWQMDGLKGAVPYGTVGEDCQEVDWFGMLGGKENKQPQCLVRNWTGGGSVEYTALPTRGKRAMKFDFVIGNPPYQDETVGEQKTFAPPIYHLFLDAVYKVADKVELIHPARFLFNAGSTPKAWNQKMLNDEHLKVLYYEQDSSKVFQNTDIKGGIAITYHDITTEFGNIGTFTAFPELNSILKKVTHYVSFLPFSNIVITRTAYRLTDDMHAAHPEALAQLSNGHPYDMATNIFDSLPQIFFDERPRDGLKYVQIFGRINNERMYKYILANYVNKVKNLYKWKVFVPAANGSGTLGEVLTTPVIGRPGIGHTETFVSIGAFDTEQEAESVFKYICSKFARVLLGVLKITQHNPPEKWKYIPLQDFTTASDIDWTRSIPEIDQQLYAKYDLDEKEIEFIETHVKEMA